MFSFEAKEQKQLKDDIFTFFCIFSRFEFALKESGFLANKNHAEANWGSFVNTYKGQFSVSNEAKKSFWYLTDADTRPNKQKVIKTIEDGHEVLSTQWEQFNMDAGAPDLQKVTDAIKVVRNNLFHGGKYGDKTWNDVNRTSLLVKSSVIMILELVNLNEYLQAYFEDFA